MIICNETACTGCMVCAEICPQSAITEGYNEKGFVHPVVDPILCIGCGMCKEVCVINKQELNKKQGAGVYASWLKNKGQRLKSSSGGTFQALARIIIGDGGVVYGAGYTEDYLVSHMRIDSTKDIKKLRGSKYVQSDTYGIYSRVQYDLESKVPVLFSGTPCQVNALKNFLKKEYCNLYLIDVVCHGVPSPKLLKDYLRWIKDKYQSAITEINFRHKKPGWSVFSIKIDFKNGKQYIGSKFKDPYWYFFNNDLPLRESCYECRFTAPERTGDITLGDFWLLKAKRFSQRGFENGVGLVLTNTMKGKELLKRIACEIYCESRTWEEAFQSNKSLLEPWGKPEKYDTFWYDYSKTSFDNMVVKYACVDCTNVRKKGKRAAWIRAHYYLFPTKLIEVFKKIKGKRQV